jgi:hypothetical protein
VNLKESEQNALADQALADFAAREGLNLDSGQTAPAASRAMGSAATPPAAEGAAEKN